MTYVERNVRQLKNITDLELFVNFIKLYFHDTGLACSPLEIINSQQLENHYLRGSLFKNYVINEFIKEAFNQGKEPHLSFWRDHKGNEIDLIKTVGDKQFAYEIKSGRTFSYDFTKSLRYWADPASATTEQCNVIYSGEKPLRMSEYNLLTLNNIC